MNIRIHDPVASLSRTPDSLGAIIRGRPDSWLDSRHAEDTLSPREAVGHMVKGEEEDWIPRIEIVLQHGESVPFSPFDPYANKDYAHTTPVEEMLTEFRRLRIRNLEKLTKLDLTDEMLDRRGTHPVHGQVTLEQLICTWAAHDIYHLGQIHKAFAVNLVDRIGPWQTMLNLPHFN